MATLMLTITQAGLDALVDAQNGETEAIVITELGLSDQVVAVSPTLEELPGEFKRIDTISGESASETVIHMNATDASEDVYDVRSMGLFLADGTLFAAHSGAGLIFRKVDVATFLFSVDVAFSEAVADAIEFGDANFLYPPATETKKGVAEIATQAETDTGADDERIVTPKKLKTLLDTIVAAINSSLGALTARTITGAGVATGGGNLSANRVITVPAASLAETNAGAISDKAVVPSGLATILANIAALFARTISGGGLVSGGGNLTANRTLTVTAATGAEVAAGVEAAKAVTPASIGSMPQDWSSVRGLGGAIMKMGTVSVSFATGGTVTFPLAFPVACDRVLLTPLGDQDDGDESDESYWVSSMSASGFGVGVQGNGNTINFAWVAFGH